jgi:hypothetical protein
MKHPADRATRRSIEAHALEGALFRQRRINGSKRKKLVELQDRETEYELRSAREDFIDQ